MAAAFPAKALSISYLPLTQAQWLANATRVLEPYEMAWETDTKQFKMGDGVSAWSALGYAGGGNQVITPTQTIGTTGNSDVSIVAPITGRIIAATFIGNDVLATSDSNYITWTITNLTNSSAAMLAATAPNTTKVTGGAAIAANTPRTLTLSGTAANLLVTAGDRLLVRAAATGTLANTVTLSQYLLNFG